MQLPSLKDICKALKDKKPGPVEKIKLEKGVTYIEILKDAEKLIKDISIKSDEIQKEYNPIFYHAVHTIVRHLMTKFSIEIVQSGSDTIDVIKVYEGSVEVSMQKIAESSDADEMAKKMEQLAQDMQEGKISPEELQRKVMEYKEQMEKEVSDVQPVVIEAGNKCTATKNSLKVEPIEENDDRWWDK
jgi:pyruvate/2-oxoglutarate dehydrogenase complex dihydrolipoamide acyltransferase (E2) component